MASEAGKGSKPRPYSVTQEQYDSRWDAIFGRDKNEDVVSEDQLPVGSAATASVSKTDE